MIAALTLAALLNSTPPPMALPPPSPVTQAEIKLAKEWGQDFDYWRGDNQLAVACTQFWSWTTGDTITAPRLNGNDVNLVTCGNAIDHTNIGPVGIWATDIKPTSTAAATFGGTFGYTFFPNSTGQIPLTIAAPNAQAADILDVTLNNNFVMSVQSSGIFYTSGLATVSVPAGVAVGDEVAQRTASSGQQVLGGATSAATIDYGVTTASVTTINKTTAIAGNLSTTTASNGNITAGGTGNLKTAAGANISTGTVADEVIIGSAATPLTASSWQTVHVDTAVHVTVVTSRVDCTTQSSSGSVTFTLGNGLTNIVLAASTSNATQAQTATDISNTTWLITASGGTGEAGCTIYLEGTKPVN